MKEDHPKRVLEICLFIIAAMMLIKSPTEVMAYLSTNLAAATMIGLVYPTFVMSVIGCAIMVFVNVLRILRQGRLWIPLTTGAVYFLTIVRWIDVV